MRERNVVAALMAAALALISAPAWSQEIAGSIVKAIGSVTVMYGAQSRPAQPGMPVQTGDRIITGPGSSAEIKLHDDTVLALGPECRIRITRFRFDPQAKTGSMLLTVVKGALKVTTGRIGERDPDAMKVRTIFGTIGARSAHFIVEAGDSR